MCPKLAKMAISGVKFNFFLTRSLFHGKFMHRPLTVIADCYLFIYQNLLLVWRNIEKRLCKKSPAQYENTNFLKQIFICEDMTI